MASRTCPTKDVLLFGLSFKEFLRKSGPHVMSRRAGLAPLFSFSPNHKKWRSFRISADCTHKYDWENFLFHFQSNTPGCLEHSFAMFEALLDAKHNQRQIVAVWLDLCNAYGSVKHNLVQFALDWYHVPPSLCNLILNYYEKISACIRTKEWSSPAFLFDLGLFQGCVLSCILFSCVLTSARPPSTLGITQGLANCPSRPSLCR